MSYVLGIDISSRAIDLVRLDETGTRAEWGCINLEGATSFQRLRQVSEQMPLESVYDDCYLAAIERPKTHSFVSAAALFPIFGAVIACLPPALELWDVTPAQWRWGLGLKGNAKKEEAREAVWKISHGIFTGLTELDGPPQDAIDAYAVAYYARELSAKGIALEDAKEKQLAIV